MSAHEDKMLSLQRQLRDNQTDLQDFLKDLDKWETDIKEKEKNLKSEKTAPEEKLPPIRNSLLKKKRRKVNKEKPKEDAVALEMKPKRISSYDYRAWDKFDVDKALESDENEEESSDYETDEEWETERKKQAAILEKDAGNRYFKEGQYESAIECYSKGVELDSTNPILVANRAMALLKLERFAAAEADCTTAIALDPTYVKAYLRRGASRLGLAVTEKAKSDFERALQLEPQNKTARTELNKINKILMKEKEESVASQEKAGCIQPVHKTPRDRSKKPLRRLKVEEIGMEESDIKAAIGKTESSQGASKLQITKGDGEIFQTFLRNETESKPTLTSAVQQDVRIPVIEELGERSNDSQGDVTPDGPAEIAGSKSSENGNMADPTAELSKSDLVKMYSPPVSPRTSPRIPGVPINSYQFQTDWKLLKNDAEAIYQYFKNIPPENYNKLFGEALESDILMKLIIVFKDFYLPNGDSVYSPLCHLTTVKRFDMIILFLSTKEKQVLGELFTQMEDKVSDAELLELKRCYGVR